MWCSLRLTTAGTAPRSRRRLRCAPPCPRCLTSKKRAAEHKGQQKKAAKKPRRVVEDSSEEEAEPEENDGEGDEADLLPERCLQYLQLDRPAAGVASCDPHIPAGAAQFQRVHQTQSQRWVWCPAGQEKAGLALAKPRSESCTEAASGGRRAVVRTEPTLTRLS